MSRTNPPGADLNVAKQRPEGWRAGKPAINGQASNTRRNLMRKHGVFLFFCCLPGNAHRGRTKLSGTMLNAANGGPVGVSIRMIRILSREQCCTARRAAGHTTARHQISQKPVLTDGLFAFLSRYKAIGLLSSNLSVCSDNIKACRSPLITIFHFIPVQALSLIPKTTRRKKM